MDSNADVEEQDIKEVRAWMATQPHLPQDIPEDLVRSFLHSNYLNFERTKTTIEAYYACKTNSPEFFIDRNLDCKGMKQVIDVIEMALLPNRTEKNHVVLFARLKNPDPSVYVLEDVVKLLFMTVDTLLQLDPVPKGVVFVFDNEGICFRHLTRVSLSTIRKYFVYIQEAMPVRMKAIHVINVNSVVAHIMNLIKPFMHKSHADQIILHSPDKTSDLYPIVPQKLLPAEYGGDLPPVASLAEKTLSDMRKAAPWFKHDESVRADDSKRQKSDKEGSTFSGMFRRLGLGS